MSNRRRRDAVIAAILTVSLVAVRPGLGRVLSCGGLPVTISGSGGHETLEGTRGDDVIHGRGGNDVIWGRGGNDVICGGGGDDILDAGSGDDMLRGGRGNDIMRGRAGADVLAGGAGNDTLRGGGGNDDLEGQAGRDLAAGGPGSDACDAETTRTCESPTGTLYVSPTGDDRADGSSEASALATVRHALGVAEPGDEIRILPGTYRERILVEGVGGAGGVVTVTGWRGRPVLDGEGRRTLGIFCERCRNVVFRNLEITGFTDIGIGATLSNGVTFSDLIVHDNGAAVRLIGWELEGYGIHVDDSHNVIIEGNDVYRNGPDPPVFPDRLLGTGINTFGLTHAKIRNNLSHDNHGGGILVEDSVDVLVEGNEVFGNDLDAWDADWWWDGGLWLDGGRDVVVRDNFFHDNLGPGIEISDEELQGPTGYVLENNVSTGNYYGIYVWNFGTNDWPAAEILRLSGNDFSGNTRRDVWIQRRAIGRPPQPVTVMVACIGPGWMVQM